MVEAGSGPPILLSHGVTLSVRTWAKQLDALAAAGFRVIAFDHRGHGESTVGTAGHGIEQLAHDMRSVIEGLDLHDVVIVGHSMGGIAAQSFCIHHPDLARARVAGIVLLSSLARSPLGANPRVARLLSQMVNRLPDGAAALARPGPRADRVADRLRARSGARPRGGGAPDDARHQQSDPPGRGGGAVLARPRAAPPRDRPADARDRGHRRRHRADRRVPPHGPCDPRCPARARSRAAATCSCSSGPRSSTG